jgi:hypothetical protein
MERYGIFYKNIKHGRTQLVRKGIPVSFKTEKTAARYINKSGDNLGGIIDKIQIPEKRKRRLN